MPRLHLGALVACASLCILLAAAQQPAGADTAAAPDHFLPGQFPPGHGPPDQGPPGHGPGGDGPPGQSPGGQGPPGQSPPPGAGSPGQGPPGRTTTISGDSSSEEEHPAPKCPKIDHVIMAMMENRPASLLMTNPDQVRNIQAMINRYSPATKYYGYTHPSEPNYIAITSGTDACTHSDNDLVYTQPSIFDQLTARGKTWRCYSQSIPSPGFNGSSAGYDPSNDTGVYKRKHNPCAMYASTVTQASGNVGYDQFLADLKANTLPTFSFVDPDQCNDMHGASGCSSSGNDTALIAQGDKWTGEFWNAVTTSLAWKKKRVLVVFVYDEDDYKTTTGCCQSPYVNSTHPWAPICPWNPKCDGGTLAPNCPETYYQGLTVTNATDVYGGGLTLAAFAYSKAHKRCVLDYPMNHLSVLKTIQHCWGLPLLGNTVAKNVPYLNRCIFK